MKWWLVIVAGLGGAGCSGVSSYAVPTTAESRPATHGPIAIFAARPPGAGRELGVVEARGERGENTVEILSVRRTEPIWQSPPPHATRATPPPGFGRPASLTRAAAP
jgi:hypothetical protein